MENVSMSKRKGFIWLNGDFVPWQSAMLHFLSHGLHYASAVFEGERAYSGVVFKMNEHHERLLNSARLLDMVPDMTVSDFNNIVNMLLVKNKLRDAYIRPLIWRGAETMGVYSRDNKLNVGIAAWEWPSYYSEEAMENGISLCWGDWERPHPATFPVHAKASGMYITGALCKNRAHDKGFDDALMKDYRGFVAECTGANIFFVIRGEIHTPNPLCFLDGITRQTVIELALERGFKVRVRDIAPEELDDAEEIFITGTAAEVLPVGRVEQSRYPVGPITQILRADYADLVRMKS